MTTSCSPTIRLRGARLILPANLVISSYIYPLSRIMSQYRKWGYADSTYCHGLAMAAPQSAVITSSVCTSLNLWFTFFCVTSVCSCPCTMAYRNQFQYVRLRNLDASASTLSEDRAMDLEDSSRERDDLRFPRFRQIGSTKLWFLLSLFMNILWGLKLFSSRTSGRILTYCEYL